jgi:hypothetical protein
MNGLLGGYLFGRARQTIVGNVVLVMFGVFAVQFSPGLGAIIIAIAVFPLCLRLLYVRRHIRDGRSEKASAVAEAERCRLCPECKEEMNRTATRCPHCRSQSNAWVKHAGRWWMNEGGASYVLNTKKDAWERDERASPLHPALAPPAVGP